MSYMNDVSKEDLERAIKNCEEECWKIAKNKNRSTKNFRKLFDHQVVLDMLKALYKGKFENEKYEQQY